MKVSTTQQENFEGYISASIRSSSRYAVSAMAQEDYKPFSCEKRLPKNHVSGVTLAALANQSIEQMIEGIEGSLYGFIHSEGLRSIFQFIWRIALKA